MEAVYLLFAFTICFGVGAAVGYGCRGLVSRELQSYTAKFEAAVAKVEAAAKAKL